MLLTPLSLTRFRAPSTVRRAVPSPGVGTQFFILALAQLLLGGIGTFYPYNRGAMKTSIVIIYVLTCCASRPLLRCASETGHGG